MAKKYKVTGTVRFVNKLVGMMVRFGIGSQGTRLLSVQGRKTGKIYSTPVILVEEGSTRWIVSPYGEVGWVRNARSAGRVTLSRGKFSENVSLIELGPVECAPVLKKYLTLATITQPYFDARPDSPLEVFEAEASNHPVFKVIPN